MNPVLLSNRWLQYSYNVIQRPRPTVLHPLRIPIAFRLFSVQASLRDQARNFLKQTMTLHADMWTSIGANRHMFNIHKY